jgi:hypothetical protein
MKDCLKSREAKSTKIRHDSVNIFEQPIGLKEIINNAKQLNYV